MVIGIGGSYLGARAAIEFLKSEKYNDLRKDTPAIYFAGNSISSTALAELVQICEGKDISINMISKSGTTTEPAIAFRVFRELLEKKYGKEAPGSASSAPPTRRRHPEAAGRQRGLRDLCGAR